MKANYTIDQNNYITSLIDFPFNENAPWIEFDENQFIYGKSRIINGEIDNSVPSSMFYTSIIEEKKHQFRYFREPLLKKYDILRINIQSGDYDPKTNLVYSPLSAEEKQWRLNMLNFTSLITAETTEDDYPVTPARIVDL